MSELTRTKRCENKIKNPQLLTKEQAADFLQVTVRGLEKWMAKRRVPFFRIGKKTVRFKMSDLESHLDQNCRVDASLN
ncbi:MAG TPA: helix-turn-helix domain-containing protein [Candidatus Angelobacter sp.]|nr:helix-turn-helix domain-containing protein [Candidatus Angelobacter sp.]